MASANWSESHRESHRFQFVASTECARLLVTVIFSNDSSYWLSFGSHRCLVEPQVGLSLLLEWVLSHGTWATLRNPHWILSSLILYSEQLHQFYTLSTLGKSSTWLDRLTNIGKKLALKFWSESPQKRLEISNPSKNSISDNVASFYFFFHSEKSSSNVHSSIVLLLQSLGIAR